MWRPSGVAAAQNLLLAENFTALISIFSFLLRFVASIFLAPGSDWSFLSY